MAMRLHLCVPGMVMRALLQKISVWPVTVALSILFLVTPLPGAPATASTADALGRENPRSSVTGFLEACRTQNLQKAAGYLDLRRYSAAYQQQQGPALANRLCDILNSDTSFNVFQLSSNDAGNLANKSNPNIEPVATIDENGEMHQLDLERTTLTTGGPQVWIFTPETVAVIPYLQVQTSQAAITRYIPKFLVDHQLLATPLWKWIALILAAAVILGLSRLLGFLFALVFRRVSARPGQMHIWSAAWLEMLVQPARVIAALILFRIAMGFIGPSAISRIYIGRAMEIVFVAAIAWSLLKLTDLLLMHFESRLEAPQQYSSRTMIRLGRRTVAAAIVVIAILFVLQSWGYNTSTLLAGLGVGGIAVALAAQQTIANVFGGVSLIGDHPIRIGEFGKFGDMEGVVEDIGMRSTRVRTLNRTIVSVPNSTFAGLNLENYSIRDKILFNPKFQIKRGTTESQLHALIDAIEKFIVSRGDVEAAQTPARLVALTSASFSVEIFCYVLTRDMNKFYRIQGDLLLAINNIFAAQNVELV